jgi:hypothetical protein
LAQQLGEYGFVNERWSAREAAARYAEDEQFAKEFEQALQELLTRQFLRLERIAARAGLSAKVEQLPFARSAFKSSELRPELAVDAEKVHGVLEQSGGKTGLTRGEIAKALGIDSREPGLSHALKLLRNQGRLLQRGERRSARYTISTRRGARSER